ncbi:MAG TPA: twin-arginine translocation signal domain-containing protein [Herpetosiphonaceae bacterium]|nr:twin-arginine translocation signal domain-containing protein [Herpetosiphonaceae bacterium]
MKYYLVFDATCSVCTHLAEEIEENTNSKLSIISIHGCEAKAMLDNVFPNGWDFAPYLICERPKGLQAWKGWGATIRLGRLLGPIGAVKVWKLARQYNVPLVIDSPKPPPGVAMSRRRFLKLGGAAAAVMGAMGLTTKEAFACTPCKTCPTIRSERGCTSGPCCQSIGTYCMEGSSCTLVDYYNASGGQYCYSRKEDCYCGALCV